MKNGGNIDRWWDHTKILVYWLDKHVVSYFRHVSTRAAVVDAFRAILLSEVRSIPNKWTKLDGSLIFG